MLKIIQAPNKVLGLTAEKIKKIDKSILHLIREMELTLISARDPEGVGLAAPQVGRSLCLFLVKEAPEAKTQVFINPEIIDYFTNGTGRVSEKNDKSVTLEGCLSLYNIWGEVNRHPGVVIAYTDEAGKSHTRKYTGFTATIIQHECDHLQGILFPKRVLEQKGQLYKSKKNEKGETEFIELEI